MSEKSREGCLAEAVCSSLPLPCFLLNTEIVKGKETASCFGCWSLVLFSVFSKLTSSIASSVALPLDFFHYGILCSLDVHSSKHSITISNKETSSQPGLLVALQFVFLEQ